MPHKNALEAWLESSTTPVGAKAAVVICGTVGVTLLFSFLVRLSQLRIVQAELNVGPWRAFLAIWSDAKGTRFTLPLGVALFGTPYIVYMFYSR